MADTKKPNLPKKGGVARIRDVANKLRKQPASPELREIFRKQNEKPSEKKIAAKNRKQESDIGL